MISKDKIRKGLVVTIQGPLQYYCKLQKGYVKDNSYIGERGVISDYYVNGDQEFCRVIVDKDKFKAEIHASHLDEYDVFNHQQMSTVDKGAIVSITGRVSTRQTHYGYNYNYTTRQYTTSTTPTIYWSPPSEKSTDKYVGKMAEVVEVIHLNNRIDHLRLKITGPKGGVNYAVCWPDAVEPLFTI